MTTVLSPEQWQEQAELHRQRAESLTAEHLERRRAGRKHPIFDFLFEYYPTKPAQLARWHPGVGVLLEGNPPHAGWRDYTTFSDGVGVDVRSFWKRRKEALLYIETLLSSKPTRWWSPTTFGVLTTMRFDFSLPPLAPLTSGFWSAQIRLPPTKWVVCMSQWTCINGPPSLGLWSPGRCGLIVLS